MALHEPTASHTVHGRGIEQLDARLKRYCLSLTQSAFDAEDLAQETWLKALSSQGFDHHPNPEALLARIAKTTWIDHTRRQATGRRLGLIHETHITWDHVADAPSKSQDLFAVEEAFHTLIKHLSPLQLSVFTLRDVLNFSVRESAQILKTSDGAIKTALYRARRALKTATEQGEEKGAPNIPTDAEELARELSLAYTSDDVRQLLTLLTTSAAPVTLRAVRHGDNWQVRALRERLQGRSAEVLMAA